MNVGVKFFIGATTTPGNDYVGTFVPQMKPFWKAAGSNEIDVVESSDSRGTRCWMYGSESGQGYCLKSTYKPVAIFFTTDNTGLYK